MIIFRLGVDVYQVTPVLLVMQHLGTQCIAWTGVEILYHSASNAVCCREELVVYFLYAFDVGKTLAGVSST